MTRCLRLTGSLGLGRPCSYSALPHCQQANSYSASGRRNRPCCTLGITFNVYGEASGTERIFPFDIIPRIVEAADWAYIERGLKQRIQALNLFIDDIYHAQKIVKDGVVPEYLIHSAEHFLPPCVGLHPARGIWCHITGTDLVRDRDGQLYVLEDNLRCPSGRLVRAGKSPGAEAHVSRSL